MLLTAAVGLAIGALAPDGLGLAAAPTTGGSCSGTHPRLVGEGAGGGALVATGPSSVVLCRFGGVNARRPYPLQASAHISDPDVLSRLVAEMNALPRIADPDAVRMCPRDSGAGIVAFFHYPGQEAPARVDVKTEGCGGASNGSVMRDTWRGTGPQLETTLSRLVPVLGRTCAQPFADTLDYRLGPAAFATRPKYPIAGLPWPTRTAVALRDGCKHGVSVRLSPRRAVRIDRVVLAADGLPVALVFTPMRRGRVVLSIGAPTPRRLSVSFR